VGIPIFVSGEINTICTNISINSGPIYRQ
jgi:hypothetical protein